MSRVLASLFIFLVSCAASAQLDFTSPILRSGKFKPKAQTGSKSRSPASAATAVEPARPAETVQGGSRELLGEPGWKAQFHQLWAGDADKISQFYSEQLDKDDVRRNRLEIEFHSGLRKMDSKSGYSVREFSFSAADLQLRSNVWFTPLIGLSGAVRFTLGGSLPSNDPTGSSDSVRNEELELGVKLRRYFGGSTQSPSVEFKIYYLDEDFRVSAESTSRLRTESAGVGVGVLGFIPSSKHHVWVMGGSIEPRLSHQEKSTDWKAKSGDSSESVGLGFDLGGEWRFDRTSQLIYGFEYRTERNLFEGPAEAADPRRGATPSNVTVDSTRLIFSLGYRWGH